MVGFRRRATGASAPVSSPISDFWVWWRAVGAARTATAIGTGCGLPTELVAEIAGRVKAIDGGLDWELAPGVRAAHLLCISSGGIAELRPTAQRWRRAAPPEDAIWEYAAARQADPRATSQTLTVGDHAIDIGETRLRIEVDDDRWRVHLGVFHPAFPEMAQRDRHLATFLMVDWLLGEDDVERWLGEITPLGEAPPDPVPVAALLEVIAGSAARMHEGWTLLEGRSSTGTRVLAAARCPLRWVDHPLLDLHHAVSLPSRHNRDDGLPTPEALDGLRVLEDSLAAALGPRGLLVAHETSAGLRTLHFYTDSEDQNGADIVERWARKRCEEGLAVEVANDLDPAWRKMRRFV